MLDTSTFSPRDGERAVHGVDCAFFVAKRCEAALKKRTLTNLYNERPTWLDLAHKKLDNAVFAVYGWPDTLTDDDILGRLLVLNHERAAG